MGNFKPAPPPISLLYVEDDATARDIACQMISRSFPELIVLSAENGKAGLDIYEKFRPDIVITDINMPVMDGIGMAGGIRAIDAGTDIIVITAYSDTSYLLDAINLGINQYVLKPVDLKKLNAAIEKCIAGITLERQVKSQNAYIRKLSLAVEQSPSMVMITDANGAIEYVNPKFTKITGYTAEEVIGQNPRLLKSGYTAPEVYENLWETINAGQEWHGEMLNRKKNDDLYWESSSISPIADENGVITHFVAVKEDISARKEAEEEIALLTANLTARAEELEAVNKELEAFNYTVSHDLRSPLTNISGYSQLLQEMCEGVLNESGREYIKEIYEATGRMDKMISDLLRFSRLSRKEPHREKFDLSAMVQSIVAELQMSSPERRVDFTIAEGVMCNGDSGLLQVAMANLIGNAWKYTGNRDAAHIEFGVVKTEGRPTYYVRDNGAGFDMKEAHRLFGAFQRLHGKDEFEGTGIGLATVQRIIQRHGGRIWAEGKVGEGATFFFTL